MDKLFATDAGGTLHRHRYQSVACNTIIAFRNRHSLRYRGEADIEDQAKIFDSSR